MREHAMDGWILMLGLNPCSQIWDGHYFVCKVLDEPDLRSGQLQFKGQVEDL